MTLPLLPFKKILVPTDFSDPARKAIISAVEMAQKFSAQLLVLHVMPPVPIIPPSSLLYTGQGLMAGNVPVTNVADYEAELLKLKRKELEAIVDEVVPKTIDYTQRVDIGEAGYDIPRIAEENDVDLIVISTRGLSGISKMLMGSVAEKVLRTATMPVMVVKHSLADE
jgi:nucleotide-binding universal stress UspA family protein